MFQKVTLNIGMFQKGEIDFLEHEFDPFLYVNILAQKGETDGKDSVHQGKHEGTEHGAAV